MTAHQTVPGWPWAVSSLDLSEPICEMKGSTTSSVPCTELALGHFILSIPSYHMGGISLLLPQFCWWRYWSFKNLNNLPKVTQPVTGMWIRSVWLGRHAPFCDVQVSSQLWKEPLPLISLSDFFTEKIPGPFHPSVFTFQPSSAWQTGQESFENGVYCSLPLTPQGRVPATGKCPLSDYCRHFLGLSGRSLPLPAVKFSASRCNISLRAFSPNRSEPTGPGSPAPVNEVCPSSFLPSLLDDGSSSYSGDAREITGPSGLPRHGTPGLTEGPAGGAVIFQEFKWPGKVWFIPIMSCFKTQLLERNVSWQEMQWFGKSEAWCIHAPPIQSCRLGADIVEFIQPGPLSLLALPGSYSFTPQGVQHCLPKGINTPPCPSLVLDTGRVLSTWVQANGAQSLLSPELIVHWAGEEVEGDGTASRSQQLNKFDRFWGKRRNQQQGWQSSNSSDLSCRQWAASVLWCPGWMSPEALPLCSRPCWLQVLRFTSPLPSFLLLQEPLPLRAPAYQALPLGRGTKWEHGFLRCWDCGSFVFLLYIFVCFISFYLKNSLLLDLEKLIKITL